MKSVQAQAKGGGTNVGASEPSSNVVNFSELNSADKQKYVDFLLSNNFVFNQDTSEDTFMATIKINQNNQQTNKSDHNDQMIRQSSASTIPNSKRDSKRALNLSNASISASRIKNAKQIINSVHNTSGSLPNNRQSKSPVLRKVALQQNQTRVLQNITNKPIVSNNNNSIDTVKIMDRGADNVKAIDAGADNLNAIDRGGSHIYKSKENKMGEEVTCQSSIVENKKQYMLEKLQLKLDQASKVSEMEEEQNEKIQASQNVQKNLNQNQEQMTTEQQMEKVTFIKQRSGSVLVSTKLPSTHDKKVNGTGSTLRRNKSIQKHNKENQEESVTLKNKKLSSDLMNKNQQYINKLQEQNIQRRTTHTIRSLSPSITPRKCTRDDTRQSSQLQKFPQKSSVRTSLQNIQLQMNQIPVVNEQNCNKETRSEKDTIIPSSFQQIMQKQTSLINSVCAKILPKKKIIDENEGLSGTINSDCSSSSSNMTPISSSLSRLSMNSQGYSRNVNMGGRQEMEEKSKTTGNDFCFEFNSFGSPCNDLQQLKQLKVNNKDRIYKAPTEEISQLVNVNESDETWKVAENEDDFKMYNVSFKRPRKIMDKEDQSSMRIGHQGSLKIQEKETQATLTELRKYSDDSFSLRASKQPLFQILKSIDELYQAKFYENTLMMKLNSNGQRGCGQRLTKQGSRSYKQELNQQLDMQNYEIHFSEFINEYFKEKYVASRKVSEQHLLNLIASVEYFLNNSEKYPADPILAIRTFAAFVQNAYQKEELIFFLFVREMLLKYTSSEFNSENSIQETLHIELSLDQCQHVLEQVYGEKESRIIERFMFRLTERVIEKSPKNFSINANFFLSQALQDYIEGKNNKIYDSSDQQPMENPKHGQIERNLQQRQLGPKAIHFEEEGEDNQKQRPKYCSDRQMQQLEMNSFEKLEYTFEQSFGEHQLITSKKFGLFTPTNELEGRIWEKMVQKIGDFIELVINDNYDEFTANEKKEKFNIVEKIVSKKINKMLASLLQGDKQGWFDLLCVSHPSVSQQNNFDSILAQLLTLQRLHISQVSNNQISQFCKTLLQTKELSRAIGKLLVCVLMPDNQI